MKKVFFLLVFVFAINVNANANTIAPREDDSTTIVNESISFKYLITTNMQQDFVSTKVMYIDWDMIICSALTVDWVQGNGFSLEDRTGRLVYWAYYHGCMRHER